MGVNVRRGPKQLGLKLEDFLSVGALQRLLGSEDQNPGDRFALIVYGTLALLVLFIFYSSYTSPRRVRRRWKEEQKVGEHRSHPNTRGTSSNTWSKLFLPCSTEP
jgi:hypothetical protein